MSIRQLVRTLMILSVSSGAGAGAGVVYRLCYCARMRSVILSECFPKIYGMCVADLQTRPVENPELKTFTFRPTLVTGWYYFFDEARVFDEH